LFVRGGLRLSLADAHLASQGGREVMLGIRPEDLRVGAGDLDVAAELISPLGSEQYVNARLGDIELVLRVDKDVTVSTGDRLRLGVDPRRLHVFDKQTGQSLSGQPDT
jgi:multiple sugar transport system ATP-binding protein